MLLSVEEIYADGMFFFKNQDILDVLYNTNNKITYCAKFQSLKIFILPDKGFVGDCILIYVCNGSIIKKYYKCTTTRVVEQQEIGKITFKIKIHLILLK